MSYIHEALKKAQRDKEGRQATFQGMTGITREKRRISPGKATVWLSIALGIIFLAFASYSWLDFRVPQPPARSETKVTDPAENLEREKRTDAGKLYKKARLFQKVGRFREATRFYKQTLALDPGYKDALNNLGVLYIREKKYDEARHFLEKAAKLHPRYVDPYYNLACLYAARGRISQSLVYLRKAVSMDTAARRWAKEDADLKALRNTPEFQNIIGKSEVAE